MGDLADVVGPLGSSEGNPNHAFQVVRDHGIGLDRFPGYTTHSGSDRRARPRTRSACSERARAAHELVDHHFDAAVATHGPDEVALAPGSDEQERCRRSGADYRNA